MLLTALATLATGIYVVKNGLAVSKHPSTAKAVETVKSKVRETVKSKVRETVDEVKHVVDEARVKRTGIPPHDDEVIRRVFENASAEERAEIVRIFGKYGGDK